MKMKQLILGFLLVIALLFCCTVDVVSQQGGGGSPGAVTLPCITKEPRLPDGTEVDCDLPVSRMIKNIGGSDGAGLCVGTSNEMMLDWHHVKGYPGKYQSWLHKFPGGSWTDKASQQIAEFAKAHNIEAPEIMHNTNGDIELQAYALKNGYVPSARIIRSPAGRYQGQSIDHMIILLGARCGPSQAWCIYDNNFPGTYEWCTEEQWKRVHAKWTMYTLGHPAPPPIPTPNK